MGGMQACCYQRENIMTIKVSAISNSEANLKIFAEAAAVVGEIEFYPHTGSIDTLNNVLITDKPEVLVLDASGGADLKLLHQIEGDLSKYPQVHAIVISPDQSVEFLALAMHVGVRKVLPVPVDAKSFREALQLARTRMVAAAQVGAAVPGGLVIGLMGVKGGSGSTFLATNLAYALGRQNKRVAVIDLRLSFGDAAIYLGNASARTNVVEMCQQYLRLDEAMLEAGMAKVSDKVHILVAAATPESRSDITPAAIEKIIDVARKNYDFVVLDLCNALDTVALKAVSMVNILYLVLTLDIPNVRAAKAIGQYLRASGVAPDRMQIVANRYLSGEHFGLPDVEKSTLIRVDRTIPNSHEAVADSINQGVPLVELTPRDPVARALKDWAEHLAPKDTGSKSQKVNGNGNGNGNGASGPVAMLRKFMGFGQ